MKLKILKVHPDAKIPTRPHPGDAGLDLYALEEARLLPGERRSVPTGVAMEIPDGCAGLIWDRGSMSHTHGLTNIGGVIDSGYRGEIHVGLVNLSDKPFVIEKGHKVAQMLIQKIESPELVEADALSEAPRGKKGFGSSGR